MMIGIRIGLYNTAGDVGGAFRALDLDIGTWVDAEPAMKNHAVLKPPRMDYAASGSAPGIVIVQYTDRERDKWRAFPAEWYKNSKYRWATFGGEFVYTPELRDVGLWAVPLFDLQD